MIRSKYFSPSELIEPSILEVLKDETAMCIVGQFICDCLYKLREDYEDAVKCADKYKSASDLWITINGNYHGSRFKYSGVRSKNCPIGAKYSKHKLGIAFDLKCTHLGILLYLIKNHWDSYYISRIENPEVTLHRGWIHVEFGFSNDLIIFNP